MSHISCSRVIPASPTEVFAFACDPQNLKALLQDHIEVEFVSGSETLEPDAEYSFNMTRYGLTQAVRLRVVEVKIGSWLAYKQIEGLFRRWSHVQKFESHGANGTLLTDMVEYELPFGIFGHLFDDLVLRKDMQKVLESRLDRLAKMLG